MQTRSPAGAIQWEPADGAASDLVPDAHDPSKHHAPMMLTTDLALKVDPAYRVITSRWLDNPEEFEDAFARAWFKLTHRDLGPRSRYLGDLAPDREFVWQDPVPEVDHPLIDAQDAAGAESRDSGFWFVHRCTRKDRLGLGIHVPRYRHAGWRQRGAHSFGAAERLAANDPAELGHVLEVLQAIQSVFNGAQSGDKRVSLADLIVLGGAAAIERAAARAGIDIDVPFAPGRMDASQRRTDVKSLAPLEPAADGFRNYFAAGNPRSRRRCWWKRRPC